MNQSLTVIAAVIFGAIAFVGLNSLYILPESRVAIVLQFGDPVATVTEPGLKVKTPFIQNVVIRDNRIQNFDPSAQELLLSDQQRVAVDYYVQYRIADIQKFYESFGAGSADTRLKSTTDAKIRDALGKASLDDLLSSRRLALIADVEANVAEEMDRFGVEIVDIRIGKADLLDSNQNQVFVRMRTERKEQADELRASGQRQARNILAEANKQARTIVAEAREGAERLRGQGDQFRITEVDGAYAANPSFASCYLALRSYDNVLGSGAIQVDDTNSPVQKDDSDVRLVLTTNNAFFDAFQSGCADLLAAN